VAADRGGQRQLCPFHQRLVFGEQSVVGIFAIGVGVMHKQAQAAPITGHGVLDHLHVTVRVSEGQDRAAADMLVDTDRLARLVVDEIDLWLANQHRFAVLDLKLADHA